MPEPSAQLARFEDHRSTASLTAMVLKEPPLDVFTGADGADGLRPTLREAADLLDMDLILLGHVNESMYTTVAFYSRDGDPSIERGDTIPIGETYCREEIVSGDIFRLEDAEGSAFSQHPGYRKYGLRSYVGASVRLSDATVFGTLCGVDGRARRVPPDKAALLGQLAAQVARLIEDRLIAARRKEDDRAPAWEA